MLPLAIMGLFRQSALSPLRLFIVLSILIYSMAAGHKEFRFIYPLLPPLFCLTADQLTSMRHQKVILIGLVVTQLPFGFYTAYWHQRGVVDVMDWLREYRAEQSIDVMFLMPCHSTPYMSHLHRPTAHLEFITCEPPIG
jgi:phosphatidylinositol glycan class B